MVSEELLSSAVPALWYEKMTLHYAAGHRGGLQDSWCEARSNTARIACWVGTLCVQPKRCINERYVWTFWVTSAGYGWSQGADSCVLLLCLLQEKWLEYPRVQWSEQVITCFKQGFHLCSIDPLLATFNCIQLLSFWSEFLPQYRSTVSTYLTVDKTTYGSYVRLYEDDKYLKLRVLVSVKINLHAQSTLLNHSVWRFLSLDRFQMATNHTVGSPGGSLSSGDVCTMWPNSDYLQSISPIRSRQKCACFPVQQRLRASNSRHGWCVEYGHSEVRRL